MSSTVLDFAEQSNDVERLMRALLSAASLVHVLPIDIGYHCIQLFVHLFVGGKMNKAGKIYYAFA